MSRPSHAHLHTLTGHAHPHTQLLMCTDIPAHTLQSAFPLRTSMQTFTYFQCVQLQARTYRPQAPTCVKHAYTNPWLDPLSAYSLPFGPPLAYIWHFGQQSSRNWPW